MRWLQNSVMAGCVFSGLVGAGCSVGLSEAQRPSSETLAASRNPEAAEPSPAKSSLEKPGQEQSAERALPVGDSSAVAALREPRSAHAEQAAQPEEHYAFHEPLPRPGLSSKSPAMQHANLQPWKCRQILKQRQLPFERDRRPTPGIATALRFTGELNGVKFRAPGGKSPYGAMDCRLALTLDAFTQVLAEHGVVLVRVDNMWRPNARLPGRKKKSQHNYGLAADVVSFELKDGRVLDVEDDFHGELGAPVCGPDSSVVPPEDLQGQEAAEAKRRAILLRNIICDVARRGIFHHMLTPNYDAAHRDHFHLDVKRDAKSWMIR